MVAPGRAALAGLIEVDETEIPSCSRNDPVAGDGGHSRQGKLLIVDAVELYDDGSGPGRIRLQEVSNYTADNLHPFIARNLAPTATGKTDGWHAFPDTPPSNISPCHRQDSRHIALLWVHRIFSNLERWTLGVYHELHPKHLQSYLVEFTFRFNRCRTRHAAFWHRRRAPTLSYKMLISPEVRT